MAGGSVLDIALVHGVSPTEVYTSLWIVVDAIHECPDLEISFPSSHHEQIEIAKRFRDKSYAGFDCCVGAIDGILIWIERPSPKESMAARVGVKKFYCGRKKKFGFNMQAMCDSEGKFLDVCIAHPGSTSDYLAFVTSPLYFKLEDDSFLAPGLAVFGDNAYVANRYMVTPFKNVTSGAKDAFNYYQSQLRINIECAFGKLVHRFGILRKALPRAIPLRRVTSLVLCTCKLHNYCIANKDGDVPQVTADDNLSIMSVGGVALEGEHGRPSALLDGCDNYGDDMNRHYRRTRQRNDNDNTPQKQLLQSVTDQDLTRPIPIQWK